jgi:hypothetical protein
MRDVANHIYSGNRRSGFTVDLASETSNAYRLRDFGITDTYVVTEADLIVCHLFAP